MSNVASISCQATQAVDTRYTQDVIPVLDTGKFEHMQRIACVMAKTSTIPDSLCKNGANPPAPLPQDTVIANCFRVVNQAVRWGMDPFAVADCASIIHGRLMWEGKLVAAVIDAKLGVKLNYKYDDKPGQELGITVFATLPGEAAAREVFGRVKDWHRGAKSPWANEGSWKRQLRYMGNREWARAHAPAVMLGVYTDDELDHIAELDVPAGARALRMKNVTPTATPLSIPGNSGLQPTHLALPDIPDEPAPAVDDAADDEPEPLADPDGYIAKLADDISFCTSAEELAEVAESNTDMIARLPAGLRKKAEAMLRDAEE